MTEEQETQYIAELINSETTPIRRDIEPPRAWGDIYTNDSEFVLLVIIASGITVSGNQGLINVYIGDGPSPTIRVGVQHNQYLSYAANMAGTLTFLVPPGWTYQATKALNQQLFEWTEYELIGSGIAGFGVMGLPRNAENLIKSKFFSKH